jgi:Cd2+/Zn2+-exporting ATPase
MKTKVLTQSLILTAHDDLDSDANRRLCERLMLQPGIAAARVAPHNGDGSLELQLTYDPRLITWNQVEREVRLSGATLRANRAAMLLRVAGLTSPSAERKIESALTKMPGVAASVSHPWQTIRIEFDRRACALADVAHRLDQLGIRIVRAEPVSAEGTVALVDFSKQSAAQPRATGDAQWSEYWKLTPASVGALLLLAGFLVHVLDGANWIRLTLLGACYLVAGWHTAIDTFRTLRQMRFDIDVLMFAAAIGAASLGHYEEGGLLLVLFAFGGAGEELALGKARSAIAALAKLAPETAIVRDSIGAQREVSVENLQIGDTVIVRPFDRIAADATVAEGASAVDQSPITGESVPVEKQPGENVFAGTINGEGLLAISVTKLAAESTLAKIVRMVNEAQTTKSPTQLFTDRIERAYVPFVLAATAALIFLPPMLGQSWSVWFYRAMAFLTAASPCALAIGTPAAVLSGIARAARLGVLIKGGAHLENLGRVNAIALDKTGTITRGKPVVTDIVLDVQGELDVPGEAPVEPLHRSRGSVDGSAGASRATSAQDDLLRLAAAVESASTHPLASAIVAHAKSRGLNIDAPRNVQQIPAAGMIGVVGGRSVTVGKLSMLPEQERSTALSETLAKLSGQGKTTVIVGVDGIVAGIIALADRPRENARKAIAALHAAGVKKIAMLTGDNAPAADAIAREVGIDEVHAQLLPEDKVRRVRELGTKHGGVAMVGDGVNDAPAMAAATVGIAMGGAGTDVALETADVALMADDLGKLSDAIGLSRFSRKIITQNLVIALGVIAVLAPLSALGFAYLGVAVLFHEGSTVVVVLNSLRLLLFRPANR